MSEVKTSKSTYYVDRFLKQNMVAADVILLGLFPDSKEISESMGALMGLYHIGLDRNDENTIAFVVGDGHVPRTGGLLAFKTKWTVVSIDPKMRITEEKFKKIQRLHMIRNHIERVNIQYEIETAKSIPDINKFDTQLIIHVHSHAYLTNSISKLFTFDEVNKDKKRLAISIPCCVPDNLITPCKSYIDRFILSPKNRVNIYPIQNMKLEV
jgi:hypothetical protein